MDEKADDKRYQEPENQLVPLREWAQALGHEVTYEYVDRASGANPARPQFRTMIADAMQRKFGGILVWKADRFSREGISNTLAYIRQLKDRGVFLKSLTESWLDTSSDNPMSELVLSIMAWAAAEERRKISERTKAGINRLRNIGQWKGGRPRLTPQPELVCNKVEGGWACKQCNKVFADNTVFVKKWNFHQRRHKWLDDNNLQEKGGGLDDDATSPTVRIAPFSQPREA